MKPASGAEPGGIENSLLLKIQSNWLSSVIHDLSNPLFAARGYLRMLLEEKNNPLTESQHRYVITALENIERMTALTQQLNDLPGKDGFDLDVVNFRDLLPRVLEDARSALPEDAAQLKGQIFSGSLSTIGDPERLAVAVHKLLHAAVEFIECAGTVQINAREENEKIVVEFWATPDRPSTEKKPVPDVLEASKIWRLHGGNCFFSPIAEGGCVISCELPVVRIQEC
jgi:signal transduction histidine kinase